ncbi:ABC transporter permease [Intrasporangium calvum]|uniref:ABC transporter permease n=1 Tax=Intrasporangium calvum TaxID=53358 RepID=UPI000DF62E81|nr:ABC transporter permease [Intrasporangium calvum]AXG14531.1 ABC transporter permease [Intrasporangium calvum]
MSNPPANAARRRAVRGPAGFVLPALALLLVVLVWPLMQLLYRSVMTPTFSFEKYQGLLTDGVSVTILTRTIVMSLIVTVVTLLLAYPYAYAMTKVKPRTRAVLMALVLLPFWTSLMARTFAWLVLLQDTGVVNALLSVVGVGPLSLIRNSTGVTIGMTQVLLPFMVLPLYSTMSKIDLRLMTAAVSLGATARVAFRRIYLPLSMPGVVAGTTLVFIMSLGFYVTPQILGSPQQAMISQLIATKIDRLLDFGSAGALSAVLIVITLVLLALMSRVVKPSEALGTTGAEE